MKSESAVIFIVFALHSIRHMSCSRVLICPYTIFEIGVRNEVLQKWQICLCLVFDCLESLYFIVDMCSWIIISTQTIILINCCRLKQLFSLVKAFLCCVCDAKLSCLSGLLTLDSDKFWNIAAETVHYMKRVLSSSKWNFSHAIIVKWWMNSVIRVNYDVILEIKNPSSWSVLSFLYCRVAKGPSFCRFLFSDECKTSIAATWEI